jgi:hypothetical protein
VGFGLTVGRSRTRAGFGAAVESKTAGSVGFVAGEWVGENGWERGSQEAQGDESPHCGRGVLI